MSFRVIPDQTFWYQSMGVAPLFNARVGGESQCQILCSLVEPLGDMAVFDFSRWRPSAILDFQKLEILTAHTLRRAKVHQLAKFCAKRSRRCGSKIWPFSIFQDGGRPPSWICYTRVWTTYEVYFGGLYHCCLLYTSPSPRDRTRSRMPSSA